MEACSAPSVLVRFVLVLVIVIVLVSALVLFGLCLVSPNDALLLSSQWLLGGRVAGGVWYSIHPLSYGTLRAGRLSLLTSNAS